MRKMIFPPSCGRECKNMCRNIFAIAVDIQFLDEKDIISWDRVFHYSVTMKDNQIVEYTERDVDIFGQIINTDKELKKEKMRCVMTCSHGICLWAGNIDKYDVFCDLSENEKMAIKTTRNRRQIRPLWFIKRNRR